PILRLIYQWQPELKLKRQSVLSSQNSGFEAVFFSSRVVYFYGCGFHGLTELAVTTPACIW
ncbi:MAG: hypothetical protein QGF90_14765, partial [Gammaproteobacteria bacterium]|nr:hypothetical protein [Gammaproteobacteria bacterium]